MNAMTNTVAETGIKPASGIAAISLQWLPKSFNELITYAELLAKSGLAPTGFNNKPEACLIAMQYGAALGLNPLQAVQNIAVINGRPCLWGDTLLALVKASPLCEWVNETLDGNTATCTVKRRGEPEQSRSYSWEDAQLAGLANKTGPWKQYPKRMLQLRARAFALRDIFPDLLMGLSMGEEIRDITPDETAQEPLDAPPIKTLPAYPQEKLQSHLNEWQTAIENGKTPEHIIVMVSSKYQLTDAQKAQIRALAIKEESENQAENNDATD